MKKYLFLSTIILANLSVVAMEKESGAGDAREQGFSQSDTDSMIEKAGQEINKFLHSDASFLSGFKHVKSESEIRDHIELTLHTRIVDAETFPIFSEVKSRCLGNSMLCEKFYKIIREVIDKVVEEKSKELFKQK